MDEKDQKSLTVGDILDQLVKPPIIQGQEIRVSQPKPAPSPSSFGIGQEKSGDINLPQLGRETGTKQPSISDLSADRAVPLGLRLSIRTMKDDLAKLKEGQVPSILEIKKAITPMPEPIPETTKSISVPPKPIPPKKEELSMEVPTVLPGISAILPKAKSPLPPVSEGKSIPAPAPFKPERSVRIADKVKIPPFLGATFPDKKLFKLEEEKVEYGVIARVIGSGMTTGIITTIVIATAVYFLIYYFFIKEEAVIATPIPTPVLTEPSPTAEINELETIFGMVLSSTFVLPEDSRRTISEFKSFMSRVYLAEKEFRRADFRTLAAQERPAFSDLINGLSVNYPSELKNLIEENNNMVLLYGQSESFNAKVEPGKRLVFITEIKDVDKISVLMRSWESTIASDLQNIFDIDAFKQASIVFLDNDRQGVKIRYKNFPLPDKSIDYAVVSSLTGRHYLLLTNSRESMYSPIDKIRGL